MAKTPKIRFAGFSDPWEMRKLGEIANYRRGSFPQPYGKSEWYDGEEAKPFIQVADITDSMNLVSDTKQKISKLAQPMSVFAEKGSVLVTLQGSIGRVAITQYGAFVDRTVLIFEKYKIDIDNLFWAYIIKQKFIKEARKAPGGTIKTITKEALSDFDLLLSNYNEQQKIGAFFSKLDKLISLHQSKFEKLQKIKKSCLQNLFPQNNQNTPKIRFKNFSDEWVKNKYKNIGQCLSGGTLSYEDLDKNGIYKCILYGELYTRYDYIIKNIVFRTNKLGNKVIKNDILFPQSTTVDAISLISPACMNDDEAQTSGVFAIRPHKNIDGNFITYYTKGNFYQRNKLAKNAQGLTIVHLYYQSIKDETILIPNLAEQCKISEFFTKLDKLIALHQSKFEKLQKIKKSCLQNMFV